VTNICRPIMVREGRLLFCNSIYSIALLSLVRFRRIPKESIAATFGTLHLLIPVSSRFAETQFAEIRVRGWCLPDSPKPVSPKLGFRVRVKG